ncbi:hypothetical protein H5410_033018 [Solanum commersonii]|uniref:Uncharacterized protein n=1 Tax=Solanum commersonii TaxID=4109 RepID=A0A9J5YPJ9_SOLCO|nr:hypothetical protein H5410_033018 [Solanum commersonii]
MANENLNKLCMDESDPMLNAAVRCKHGILLNLQTSWSKLNPGRKFWSCPCYGGQRRSGSKIKFYPSKIGEQNQ